MSSGPLPLSTTLQPGSTINNSTTLAPDGTSNVPLIVGCSVGALAFVILIVILCCCIIRRRLCIPGRIPKNIPADEKIKATDCLLIGELQNHYAMRKSDKDNAFDETSYVALRNEEKTSLCYASEDVTDNSARIKVPMIPKPKPSPKPVHLKPMGLDNSNSGLNTTVGRKPIPAPRPDNLNLLSNDRQAENELYNAPDIYLEANNEIYSAPNDRQNHLHNTTPSTSAQLFTKVEDPSVSDIDEKLFAVYVPVGERDTIYKIPSNVEKFDPPSCPPQQYNAFDETYMDMDGDNNYNSLNAESDYEDVTDVFQDNDTYESMNAASECDASGLYENLPRTTKYDASDGVYAVDYVI